MLAPRPQPTGTADPVLAAAFSTAVVPASARYWAAHFSHPDVRPCVQAIFCFAHLMDQLALASPEVIREKSLWWHEELQRFSVGDARHPILQIVHRLGQHQLATALHEHLHGALSTQQQIAISDTAEWHQYAQLRLGSLHQLLGLSAGLPTDSATAFGQWAGILGMHAVVRAPQLFTDGRWTVPTTGTNTRHSGTPPSPQLHELLRQRPGPGATASEVLLANDLLWWRSDPTVASPLYSNSPLGIRSMFCSWRAARATPYP